MPNVGFKKRRKQVAPSPAPAPALGSASASSSVRPPGASSSSVKRPREQKPSASSTHAEEIKYAPLGLLNDIPDNFRQQAVNIKAFEDLIATLSKPTHGNGDDAVFMLQKFRERAVHALTRPLRLDASMQKMDLFKSKAGAGAKARVERFQVSEESSVALYRVVLVHPLARVMLPLIYMDVYLDTNLSNQGREEQVVTYLKQNAFPSAEKCVLALFQVKPLDNAYVPNTPQTPAIYANHVLFASAKSFLSQLQRIEMYQSKAIAESGKTAFAAGKYWYRLFPAFTKQCMGEESDFNFQVQQPIPPVDAVHSLDISDMILSLFLSRTGAVNVFDEIASKRRRVKFMEYVAGSDEEKKVLAYERQLEKQRQDVHYKRRKAGAGAAGVKEEEFVVDEPEIETEEQQIESLLGDPYEDHPRYDYDNAIEDNIRYNNEETAWALRDSLRMWGQRSQEFDQKRPLQSLRNMNKSVASKKRNVFMGWIQVHFGDLFKVGNNLSKLESMLQVDEDGDANMIPDNIESDSVSKVKSLLLQFRYLQRLYRQQKYDAKASPQRLDLIRLSAEKTFLEYEEAIMTVATQWAQKNSAKGLKTVLQEQLEKQTQKLRGVLMRANQLDDDDDPRFHNQTIASVREIVTAIASKDTPTTHTVFRCIGCYRICFCPTPIWSTTDGFPVCGLTSCIALGNLHPEYINRCVDLGGWVLDHEVKADNLPTKGEYLKSFLSSDWQLEPLIQGGFDPLRSCWPSNTYDKTDIGDRDMFDEEVKETDNEAVNLMQQLKDQEKTLLSLDKKMQDATVLDDSSVRKQMIQKTLESDALAVRQKYQREVSNRLDNLMANDNRRKVILVPQPKALASSPAMDNSQLVYFSSYSIQVSNASVPERIVTPADQVALLTQHFRDYYSKTPEQCIYFALKVARLFLVSCTDELGQFAPLNLIQDVMQIVLSFSKREASEFKAEADTLALVRHILPRKPEAVAAAVAETKGDDLETKFTATGRAMWVWIRTLVDTTSDLDAERVAEDAVTAALRTLMDTRRVTMPRAIYIDMERPVSGDTLHLLAEAVRIGMRCVEFLYDQTFLLEDVQSQLQDMDTSGGIVTTGASKHETLKLICSALINALQNTDVTTITGRDTALRTLHKLLSPVKDGHTVSPAIFELTFLDDLVASAVAGAESQCSIFIGTLIREFSRNDSATFSHVAKKASLWLRSFGRLSSPEFRLSVSFQLREAFRSVDLKDYNGTWSIEDRATVVMKSMLMAHSPFLEYSYQTMLSPTIYGTAKDLLSDLAACSNTVHDEDQFKRVLYELNRELMAQNHQSVEQEETLQNLFSEVALFGQASVEQTLDGLSLSSLFRRRRRGDGDDEANRPYDSLLGVLMVNERGLRHTLELARDCHEWILSAKKLGYDVSVSEDDQLMEFLYYDMLDWIKRYRMQAAKLIAQASMIRLSIKNILKGTDRLLKQIGEMKQQNEDKPQETKTWDEITDENIKEVANRYMTDKKRSNAAKMKLAQLLAELRNAESSIETHGMRIRKAMKDRVPDIEALLQNIKGESYEQKAYVLRGRLQDVIDKKKSLETQLSFEVGYLPQRLPLSYAYVSGQDDFAEDLRDDWWASQQCSAPHATDKPFYVSHDTAFVCRVSHQQNDAYLSLLHPEAEEHIIGEIDHAMCGQSTFRTDRMNRVPFHASCVWRLPVVNSAKCQAKGCYNTAEYKTFAPHAEVKTASDVEADSAFYVCAVCLRYVKYYGIHERVIPNVDTTKEPDGQTVVRCTYTDCQSEVAAQSVTSHDMVFCATHALEQASKENASYMVYCKPVKQKGRIRLQYAHHSPTDSEFSEKNGRVCKVINRTCFSNCDGYPTAALIESGKDSLPKYACATHATAYAKTHGLTMNGIDDTKQATVCENPTFVYSQHQRPIYSLLISVVGERQHEKGDHVFYDEFLYLHVFWNRSLGRVTRAQIAQMEEKRKQEETEEQTRQRLVNGTMALRAAIEQRKKAARMVYDFAENINLIGNSEKTTLRQEILFPYLKTYQYRLMQDLSDEEQKEAAFYIPISIADAAEIESRRKKLLSKSRSIDIEDKEASGIFSILSSYVAQEYAAQRWPKTHFPRFMNALFLKAKGMYSDSSYDFEYTKVQQILDTEETFEYHSPYAKPSLDETDDAFALTPDEKTGRQPIGFDIIPDETPDRFYGEIEDNEYTMQEEEAENKQTTQPSNSEDDAIDANPIYLGDVYRFLKKVRSVLYDYMESIPPRRRKNGTTLFDQALSMKMSIDKILKDIRTAIERNNTLTLRQWQHIVRVLTKGGRLVTACLRKADKDDVKDMVFSYSDRVMKSIRRTAEQAQFLQRDMVNRSVELFESQTMDQIQWQDADETFMERMLLGEDGKGEDDSSSPRETDDDEDDEDEDKNISRLIQRSKSKAGKPKKGDPAGKTKELIDREIIESILTNAADELYPPVGKWYDTEDELVRAEDEWKNPNSMRSADEEHKMQEKQNPTALETREIVLEQAGDENEEEILEAMLDRMTPPRDRRRKTIHIDSDEEEYDGEEEDEEQMARKAATPPSSNAKEGKVDDEVWTEDEKEEEEEEDKEKEAVAEDKTEATAETKQEEEEDDVDATHVDRMLSFVKGLLTNTEHCINTASLAASVYTVYVIDGIHQQLQLLRKTPGDFPEKSMQLFSQKDISSIIQSFKDSLRCSTCASTIVDELCYFDTEQKHRICPMCREARLLDNHFVAYNRYHCSSKEVKQSNYVFRTLKGGRYVKPDSLKPTDGVALMLDSRTLRTSFPLRVVLMLSSVGAENAYRLQQSVRCMACGKLAKPELVSTTSSNQQVLCFSCASKPPVVAKFKGRLGNYTKLTEQKCVMGCEAPSTDSKDAHVYLPGRVWRPVSRHSLASALLDTDRVPGDRAFPDGPWMGSPGYIDHNNIFTSRGYTQSPWLNTELPGDTPTLNFMRESRNLVQNMTELTCMMEGEGLETLRWDEIHVASLQCMQVLREEIDRKRYVPYQRVMAYDNYQDDAVIDDIDAQIAQLQGRDSALQDVVQETNDNVEETLPIMVRSGFADRDPDPPRKSDTDLLLQLRKRQEVQGNAQLFHGICNALKKGNLYDTVFQVLQRATTASPSATQKGAKIDAALETIETITNTLYDLVFNVVIDERNAYLAIADRVAQGARAERAFIDKDSLMTNMFNNIVKLQQVTQDDASVSRIQKTPSELLREYGREPIDTLTASHAPQKKSTGKGKGKKQKSDGMIMTQLTVVRLRVIREALQFLLSSNHGARFKWHLAQHRPKIQMLIRTLTAPSGTGMDRVLTTISNGIQDMAQAVVKECRISQDGLLNTLAATAKKESLSVEQVERVKHIRNRASTVVNVIKSIQSGQSHKLLGVARRTISVILKDDAKKDQDAYSLINLSAIHPQVLRANRRLMTSQQSFFNLYEGITSRLSHFVSFATFVASHDVRGVVRDTPIDISNVLEHDTEEWTKFTKASGKICKLIIDRQKLASRKGMRGEPPLHLGNASVSVITPAMVQAVAVPMSLALFANYQGGVHFMAQEATELYKRMVLTPSRNQGAWSEAIRKPDIDVVCKAALQLLQDKQSPKPMIYYYALSAMVVFCNVFVIFENSDLKKTTLKNATSTDAFQRACVAMAPFVKEEHTYIKNEPHLSHSAIIFDYMTRLAASMHRAEQKASAAAASSGTSGRGTKHPVHSLTDQVTIMYMEEALYMDVMPYAPPIGSKLSWRALCHHFVWGAMFRRRPNPHSVFLRPVYRKQLLHGMHAALAAYHSQQTRSDYRLPAIASTCVFNASFVKCAEFYQRLARFASPISL
jgi:hypothetical protein